MEQKESTSNRLLEYGLKAVLLAGAVYGISKIIKDFEKNSTEKQAIKKIEVSQAMTIYSAMNQSGMNWMKKMDGTNLTVLFETAKQIIDFSKVQDAYQKLYNTSLLTELREELSPSDYNKFLNTIRLSPQNTSWESGNQKIEFEKGDIIATKLQVNLRRSPKVISKLSFENNIISLSGEGKFIGFYTGKSEFDNSGSSQSGTLFLQIEAIALDSKKPITFWAAASQLKTISKEDYKAKKYPFFWVNEKDVLNGFDSNQKKLVASFSTALMDEKFRVVAIASPSQKLGYSIMQLDDNKGNKYIQFITSENKKYWVNQKSVRET